MPEAKPASDPTLEAGSVDEPTMPCDHNDVEVVSDLDEPNGIEMESEVEDEEPGGLVFAATVAEPGGSRFVISEDSFEDEEEEDDGDEEPEESASDADSELPEA
jgi:hypothetical protein